MSSSYLLAIHEDSNANVTLFEDGRVVFASAEERFSRVRFQGGFPFLALERALGELGLSLERIDRIVCGNRYHFLPRVFGRRFPTFEHPFLGTSQKLSLLYQDLVFAGRLPRSAIAATNATLLRRFLGRRPDDIVDHHHAHAYSAYLTSGFANALAITVDNYGDGFSAGVFECREGRCDLRYGSSAMQSPGQFYGEISQVLGFHPLQAGKMTAMAAYGDPAKHYELVEPLLGLDESREDFRLPSIWRKSEGRGVFGRLATLAREDVAAAAQKRFEDVMIDYIAHAVRKYGAESVVLAGGIFSNVSLNRMVLDLEGVRRVFIHPAMSDLGISMGAGLAHLAQTSGLKPFVLPHLYLGPRYGNDDVEQALEGTSYKWEHADDAPERLARALADGKLVGICAGRMEYGPRALGNRSILYQATDPTTREWLNRRLRRSPFMPFAPVTLASEASRCYEGMEGAEEALRFMTISVPCTDWMKRTCPGAIHVDGTARPQILHAEDNPRYHAILAAYHRMTAVPCLINTSFNLHEEPIVCTPTDALRSMGQAGLDYLLLGDYVVCNPDAGRPR